MGKMHDKFKAKTVQRVKYGLAVASVTRKDPAAKEPETPKAYESPLKDGEDRMQYEQRLRDSPVVETRIGVWDGHCNRSACRRAHARWWNRGSYSHYCYACATMLNQVNRADAYDLLGHGNELCVEESAANHWPLGPAKNYYLTPSGVGIKT